MKVRFNKDGLTFNDKVFHPLNMGLKGYEIESNETVNTADATEILESLSLIRAQKNSKIAKMRGLKEVIDKANG